MNTTFAGILAGVLIGLGDIIYLTCENHIVGAFLFSLGLLTILIKGFPLYTGRVGYINPLKISDWGNMGYVLVANCIGMIIVCTCADLSRLDLSSIDTIVTTKLSQTWYSTLFLSWCCGVMMYIAVNGWKTTKNPIMVIMPIMFFILGGFEHCIANYGYMYLYSIKHCNIIEENLNDPLISLAIMVVGNALGSLTFSKVNVN